MKLFERYFGSNFEKLLTYYPRYYRDVFEMVEILKVQGGLADELENNIEQVFLNCFIDFADENTIRQLEIFLKVGLNNKLTLDQRRRIVKSYFIGAGKLSGSQLAKMLQNITGCAESDIRLAPIDEAGNNALLIDFECQENAAQKLAAVQELFIRKVPAHLKMLITAISRFEIKFQTREQFQPISLKMPFYFSNQPNDITLLNGRRRLDGSWKLDSTFRGITSRKMCFVSGFAEKMGAMAVASLTRDTMWRLEGSVRLDGSKKLNAAIVKEVI